MTDAGADIEAQVPPHAAEQMLRRLMLMFNVNANVARAAECLAGARCVLLEQKAACRSLVEH
jgi:hypothetical protein